MGRLDNDLLGRIEAFCDRVVTVADALADTRCSRRIVDQISGSGTSVGANCFEADQGLSRADFRRCLGIALRELNETRFWIRLIGRREWLPPERLAPLEQECLELQRILGTMIVRTKRRTERTEDGR